MLKSLKIENFRGFQSFELQQLGRINLLVGENSSGKSSILEALYLLRSPGNPQTLSKIMQLRGEYIWNIDLQTESQLDIANLFYEREIQLDSRFLLVGNSQHNQLETLSVSVVSSDDLHASTNPSLEAFKGLGLLLEWKPESVDLELPISFLGGVSVEGLKYKQPNQKSKLPVVQSLTSSSFSISAMTQLFEKIVLTPEEEFVNQALQIVDAQIERIAVIRNQGYQSMSSRGGFFVRLSEHAQRVPIGSLGEGTWHMLGLALGIACSKNGILMVDDIDSGLHFSTMRKMWKMIWEIAQKLNVQVFATTHSQDCWNSLAELIESEQIAEDEISIHRIEKGKNKSIIFDADQIVIAAERGIEVR